MGISLVLALVLYPSSPAAMNKAARIGAHIEYEEPAWKQALPGYHPALRFLQGERFVFLTPNLIAEGHYSLQGTHYEFRPETAVLLNHADIDKIAGNMPPEAGRALQKKYSDSLAPFVGDYDKSDGALNLKLAGPASFYTVYDYTAGDSSLSTMVTDDERPLIGFWGQTDPFPEKLDSKTRYRIGGQDGLEKFASEASASDSAEFNVIDLRSDGTYRMHEDEGRWHRNGATLTLQSPKGDMTLQISRDLTKLKMGGVTYMR